MLEKFSLTNKKNPFRLVFFKLKLYTSAIKYLDIFLLSFKITSEKRVLCGFDFVCES